MRVKYALMSIVTLLLTSCMSTYYQTFFMDKQLSNAMRVVDTLHNREVILIGMPHLGTVKGYDALRNYILERNAEGYVFFLEGVDHHNPIFDGPYDSLKQDTIERKLRFVTGFSLGSYADNENESLPEMYKTIDHAISPTAELLGLDKVDSVFNVDLTLGEIILSFEKKFGEIPLTQYDFDTPLKAKYIKNKDYPYNIFSIASPVREMYVVDAVVESQYSPKIIIMYGYGHLYSLAAKLNAVGYDDTQFHYLKKEKSKARKNKPSKTK